MQRKESYPRCRPTELITIGRLVARGARLAAQFSNGSIATDGFRACAARCPLLRQERSFQMASAGEVCLTHGIEIEYEDMVSVVVRRIKYVLAQFPNKTLDTRSQVEAALRLAWPCKK
jgi:hypothetical protein